MELLGVEMILLLLALLALGALAGFLAGLLGIGGGMVLVPGLYYSLLYLGYDPAILMHVAVGTSMAIIVPTGLSSARAHWKKDGIVPGLVKKLGVGVLAGVLAGTVIADQVSGQTLKIIFAVAISLLALLMLIDPSRFQFSKSTPGWPVMFPAGGIIGTLSTLMGIGGATLSVPFMTLSGTTIHKAVGTASALGLVISVPATLGYVVIGAGETAALPFSFGYVNALAWGIIVPVSVLCAPLGVKTAHSVSVKRLRGFFAVFMFVVAAKMLHGAFYG